MADRLSDRWRNDQRLRFLAVGGWNTLFGYLVFVSLYALLGNRLHYLVIGLISHAVAVTNAFICHRRMVFRSSGPWFAEFVRFNVAQLSVVGGGVILLGLLVELVHLHPLLAQAVVTAVSVLASYLAHRYFTFGRR